MIVDDKLIIVDFYQFICDNMNNYKNVSEAWEAFKKERELR